MTHTNNASAVVEAKLDRRNDTIAKLFERSPAARAIDRELEDIISAAIEGHLRENNITQNGDLKSLSDKFKNSDIPAEPCDIPEYFDAMVHNLVPESMHLASPRYIGHMASALPRFVPALAKFITTINQNVVKLETSRVLTFCERQALGKMHRLVFGRDDSFYGSHIQRSDSTLGVIVSGGTTANITALWCARNAAFGPMDGFRGVEASGFSAAMQAHGYTGAVIIGSSLMHYSVDKAAAVLGIGTDNVIKLAVPPDNHLDPQLLRNTILDCRKKGLRVVALFGSAGATDSGAIDPLPQMADIAQEFNIHFHVDAAWGGPLLFSKTYQNKLAGIERADSVTIDGHKQLYLPFGIGMALFRDPHTASVIEKNARYIVRPGSIDLGRRSLEGSRPAMALYLDVALNAIGRNGYEYLIDEGIRKARYLADRIANTAEFELLRDPEINIVNYRYIPEKWVDKVLDNTLSESDNVAINRFNERLQKAQRQAGRSFVSRTTLETTRYGRQMPIVALRAVIANPLTTEADINAVLSDQVVIAASLSKH
jgi:glutamate decarboxylase